MRKVIAQIVLHTNTIISAKKAKKNKLHSEIVIF